MDNWGEKSKCSGTVYETDNRLTTRSRSPPLVGGSVIPLILKGGGDLPPIGRIVCSESPTTVTQCCTGVLLVINVISDQMGVRRIEKCKRHSVHVILVAMYIKFSYFLKIILNCLIFHFYPAKPHVVLGKT